MSTFAERGAIERKPLSNEIKSFAGTTPFKTTDLKRTSHSLDNYLYMQKFEPSILDRIHCKLFGHKKMEVRYYEDVEKDDFKTKDVCLYCNKEL
ncbi:MAG: hypothetical protein ABFD07_11500 [Methanobacterium sp.]